ncbi:hypothetical protein HCH_00643 [Hahella chejuensis KCTC 2396]|uniref:Uncharacterized protein n=1 Tax=Hahella chejuensis (strain KCTC 2396) TaxID=349521 RepID=Q2SP80_HAHCH|nr:hypothetical protein [Hahella chejuensis]ABC27544.1 hypothetical protein HCH_00643 [Hahella chejuensis KCTC 2396]
MLLEAPIESTLAAALTLFGITYTVRTVLNHLIKRAQEKRDAATVEAGDTGASSTADA